MKILIAGGTGFLGTELSNYFTNQKDVIKVLTRKATLPYHVEWDAKNLDSWTEEIEWCDVLINLCGKSVDCRYTSKNRDLILSSRIVNTELLHLAVANAAKPPALFINASSATIYIHSDTRANDETDGIIGDDFSMGICKQWETSFFKNKLSTTRKVALRSSIVLGKKGGAYPKLKWTTRLGLGGKHGDGTQMVSWIHIDDFCRSIDFIIKNKELRGPINITAPHPISNNTLMSKLRKSMSMPFGISTSRIMLEIGSYLIRTETELLLKSRWVLPSILINKGFKFSFPDIDAALSDLR
jgi:uncharacterized protein (TIGR01777 family)